jgi:integrase
VNSDQIQASSGESGSPFVKVAECLYRNKVTGIYYGLVKRGRKQFRKSFKTTDRKLAERRLSDYRKKVGGLNQVKGASQYNFEKLANRWFETIKSNMKPASARRRKTSIRQLIACLGKTPVRNLTSRDCDNWVIKRGGKISASAFNNERETMSLIFDFAKRDGLILDNPAKHIKRRRIPKSEIVIPTREQFRLLVENMRELDCRALPGADLVELLAYSGMRLAEATSLLWGEIDFERGCFTVTGGEVGTKNSEARTVPLFPALRNFLVKLRGEKTPPATQRVIPVEGTREAIKKSCKAANMPHFTHHTMRHYFVSNAIEAGIDFKVIAGWVGHKDGGVLVAKTYGHLRDTHSFEMARRMTFSAAETPPENVVPINTAIQK